MKKTARWIVVGGITLLAILIATLVPSSDGAHAVTGQDLCTLFVDYDNYSIPDAERGRAHMYFMGPRPDIQRPGDWQYVRVVHANGRRHPQLARGWTLDYNWAHHTPCSPN